MAFIIRDKASSRKRRSKSKIVISEEDRRKKALHIKVFNTFKNMGFEYLHTEGKEQSFNGQNGELDNIFFYKNIILMVEETVTKANSTDHIKKKLHYFNKIKQDLSSFISWLKNTFKEKFENLDDFSLNEYKFFYLYATDLDIPDDTKEAINELKFIDSPILEYFHRLSGSIKHTSKYELFKFLNLSLEEIDHARSDRDYKSIDTVIIMPESSSGFPDGIQVVTFVMRAKELMDCSYVLRKDSWDPSLGLYQRLLERSKIEKIRKFIAEKQRTFIDSIVVSLPFEAEFYRNDPEKGREKINVFNQTALSNITMTIPYELNSIGIIDGQHRIFSHYEGNDVLEDKIAKLRNKRHLFVTGLFFDKNKFKQSSKCKFESELFLQINSEQKKVDKRLLQDIEAVNNPYSSVGIANNILKLLNKKSPFLKVFSLTPFDKIGLKTPSISQFGLQSLIAIDITVTNLYTYWQRENDLDVKDSDEAYNSYIKYCVANITIFFKAIESHFQSDWDITDKDSRLLSVTPIVAFFLAYRKSLEIFDGPQNYNFYKEKISKLDVNFREKPFRYTSSQWYLLASIIEDQCWL